MYHRNIFRSSSKVFGNLRKSLDIFGNFRKFSENVRERSSVLIGTILENLRKPSESCQKSLENHQKRGYQYVHIIKEHYTLARRYEFYVLNGKSNISLVHCIHS